jgi:ribosomal subunit interface protein
MKPVQITLRDIEVSAAIEAEIQSKIQKLRRLYAHICSCHVVIEAVQKRQHQGKVYNVRIDLTVPRGELVSTRKESHDVYIAVRKAFDALERRLESYVCKRQGRIKKHRELCHGHVSRLLADEGYGFIEGKDGNEYYFSITSVAYPRFNQLTIGDSVEYIAEALSEGWQAHHIIKEHHSSRLP